MISDILWVLYYRFKCFKLTVNSTIFNTFRLKIEFVIDNIVRIFIWLLLLLLITPVELVLAVILHILDFFSIAQEFSANIKYMFIIHGRNKEVAMKEYQMYEQFLLDEEKK